jgi:hypothetical protein
VDSVARRLELLKLEGLGFSQAAFTEKLNKDVDVHYRHWSLDQKKPCMRGRSLVGSSTRLSISTSL